MISNRNMILLQTDKLYDQLLGIYILPDNNVSKWHQAYSTIIQYRMVLILEDFVNPIPDFCHKHINNSLSYNISFDEVNYPALITFMIIDFSKGIIK